VATKGLRQLKKELKDEMRRKRKNKMKGMGMCERIK